MTFMQTRLNRTQIGMIVGEISVIDKNIRSFVVFARGTFNIVRHYQISLGLNVKQEVFTFWYVKSMSS